MLSRRFFIKSSGLALAAFGVAPRFLIRSAFAAAPGRGQKSLVVVFLRGGCDGLNLVVPYAEERYRSLRPTIAIPPPGTGGGATALDLDGFFGLHPALEPLLPLWQEQRLAAVHAVGSPHSTRSHFDAQDFMESGTPGRKSTRDGWMNRHLQALPDPDATPVRGVALAPTLPRSLAGPAPALAISSLEEFGLHARQRGTVTRGFERMYGEAEDDRLSAAGRDALEAIRFLERARSARSSSDSGARYPRGRFGDSLRQIAQLIKDDVGLELAFAEAGGWDHHVAEGGVQGQLTQRARELGAGLAAFQRDLGKRMQEVVLVTLTEFGRTARENGNRGTDHGHASVSLVLGAAVRGGRVHGRWPGLASSQLYEGRDLAVTTDFRDLLGELLLARHLGATNLAHVFPGHAVDAPRFLNVLRG